MRFCLFLIFLVSSNIYAETKGLTDFEKARMIPDSLNSVMLSCESSCSSKNQFESKDYQMCYKGCLDSEVIIKSRQPQREGLSNFEKAQMTPDNLNSMMLMCESDCSKKHDFESKPYQACNKECLGKKISSSSEFAGCAKDVSGRSITCQDGLYLKSTSPNDSARDIAKKVEETNVKEKIIDGSAVPK
jgi:hypothetical protein